MKMKELDVAGDSAQHRRENASPVPEKEDLRCASKIVFERKSRYVFMNYGYIQIIYGSVFWLKFQTYLSRSSFTIVCW